MPRPQVSFVLTLAACLLVGCAGTTSATAQDAADAPAQAQPQAQDPPPLEERIAWWNEARFGMFIHWGLYAIPAGEWEGRRVGGYGEWIMSEGRITPEAYRPLAEQFNPTEFDAEAWVALMKEAGCQYFVITTKHHDGFALFRSDVSDYDIAATPFGEGNDRDIMRELADAAREAGIRIGWYHSIMDWQHPDYLPRREWDHRPTDTADFDRYVQYMNAQIEEILTNYGEIDIIWFDGEWQATWTHERGIALYDHCQALAPNILINNRVDKGRQGSQGMNAGDHFRGDFGTPEQQVPATGFGEGVYWESCITMNGTWGYRSDDHDWKSTTYLIHQLIDIASKGGNYLLNVGPDATGTIPEPSQDRLRAMGQWLAVNGEAIYGTQASPIGGLTWGRCTSKPLDDGNTALYLHVFDWPEDGRIMLPGIKNTVVGASGLHLDMMLRVQGAENTDAGIVVQAIGEAWDEHASVIKLVIEGEPEIDAAMLERARWARPDAEGRYDLSAEHATIQGEGAKVEHAHGPANVGHWTDPDTTVRFTAVADGEGLKRYNVQIEYALAGGGDGSTITLAGGLVDLETTLAPTGGWGSFTTQDLGTITFLPNEEGCIHIDVVPQAMSGQAVMNLRRIVLTPAEE